MCHGLGVHPNLDFTASSGWPVTIYINNVASVDQSLLGGLVCAFEHLTADVGVFYAPVT